MLASRSWRTGHRKIETPDSASQNASSPCFPRTMLSASAEIEHIFLCDQILVDSCRFHLDCPRNRRVGIPASMEVLPEQPIFCWPGGFWFWAKLKITASVIENCTFNKKKTHPNQPIGTEGRFPRRAWQLKLRSGNLRDMGLQGGC